MMSKNFYNFKLSQLGKITGNFIQRTWLDLILKSYQHRFKNKGKLRTESIRLLRMQQKKRKYKENKAKGR